MPIEVQGAILVFEQGEFHSLSHRVLRMAFDVHNDLGRFLDEELCKRELAERCLETGIAPVHKEVRIRVWQDSFQKD